MAAETALIIFETVPDVDHFWQGAERRLAERCAEYINRLLDPID